MDLALHEVREGGVDHPVTRHGELAAESLGNDADPEMAGPSRRPGVAGVQMALVSNRQLERPELIDQPLTQPLLARGRAHGGAASDCAGFALPFSQSTWGIMNTSMAAVIPNTLNFTQTPSG